MVNKTAPALVLREGDRVELERLTRSGTVRASSAQRARIVLLAADGVGNQMIADTVGVSRPTVNLWRDRYAERGLAGLVDEPRPGRPRQVDRAKVIAATLAPPPASLGVTHWSSRLLAARLGLDHSTVAGVWKEFGVKPWKADTFKFSTDPELVAKVTDVVGLYLAPPDNAIVLSGGREEPDPGVEPDPEGAPAPARPRRTTHPRLRAPPTRRPRSATGSPRTPAATSTSPRHQAHG